MPFCENFQQSRYDPAARRALSWKEREIPDSAEGLAEERAQETRAGCNQPGSTWCIPDHGLIRQNHLWHHEDNPFSLYQLEALQGCLNRLDMRWIEMLQV